MSEIKVTRINHVGIPISTRKNTLPFYRDVLGLKVIASQVDNANVVWTQLPDGAMVHPIETDDPRSGASHVAFQVEDWDSAFAKLQELGFEIASHGERHDGQRFLFIADPDGNRIEITTGNDLKSNDRVSDEWGYTT